MPFTLTLPKLSPTMEGGTIVKWHKKEGDSVKSGEVLFEVATDKATIEYEALDAGFLRKILISEGKEALVSQPVAVFTESEGEAIEDYLAANIYPKPLSTPQLNERKEEKSEPLFVQKSESFAIPSPFFPIEPPLEEYSFEFEIVTKDRLAASPLARKLAREKKIDLTSIKGSGPNGRIMSRDLVLGASKGVLNFGFQKKPEEKPGSYSREPMTPMRKAIASKLQASKTFIPHFYIQQEIDAEPMTNLRAQLKEGEIQVTLNDLIIRGVALSLKHHPKINAGYDYESEEIIYFKTIDIAVAVSLPEGLITPIIRHVDYKNLWQLSAEVKHLAALAKQGKLQPNQYRGGSFTISNLGMFGIHHFQAIINPPQVAILSVGAVRESPVAKMGNIVVGKRLMLSLSSDHRIVDGTDAASFILTLKKYLENPALLLI